MIPDQGRRIKGSHFVILDQVLVSVSSFVISLLLVRTLGLDKYGSFVLLWMYAQFCQGVQNALLISPLQSIGAKLSQQEIPEYLGALIIFQILFSLLSVSVLILGYFLIDLLLGSWDGMGLFFPLLASVLGFQIHDFFRRVYLAQFMQSISFAGDIINYGSQILVISIFMIVGGLTLEILFWVVFLSSVGSIIYYFFKFKKVVFRRHAITKFSSQNWYFSKWLLASVLTQWLSSNMTFLLVGYILGPVLVGAMKACQNTIAILHVIFQSLENYVPIRTARILEARGVIQMNAYLLNVFKTISIPVLLFLLVVFLYSEEVLRLVYGQESVAYTNLLDWYAVLYVFVFICLPFRFGLRAMEVTRPIFVAYCYSLIFSLVVSVPAICLFSGAGAMMSLLGQQLIILFLLNQSFRTIKEFQLVQ